MPSKDVKDTKQTYRELQAKLDAVLTELQADDVDVDTALDRYKEGLRLVELLEARLKTAKNSVRELKKHES